MADAENARNEAAEAEALLRRLLDAWESGDLDASPIQVASLRAALTAITEINSLYK